MSTSTDHDQPAQMPIAIVGMGSLFPNAQGLHDYWRLIRGGEDGITDVPATHWTAADYFDDDPKSPDRTYCQRGGFLSPVDFDPTEFGIPPTTLEATDTAQLLGLIVAKQALEDAGYGDGREFDRRRTGVILGVTSALEMVVSLGARLGHPKWRRALADAGVSANVANDVIRRISESYVGWQENSFPGLLGNVVAGRIANRLDLRGTNCVTDAACASSLSAMHMAVLELSAGRSDMVVTGGVDAFNDIFMFMCFSKTQALSPTGDCRPFSAEADGTVIGEGVGMVVLKRLADAERDGDRIYAVLRGIGSSSDGKSQSIYAPVSAGQAEALRTAYQVSRVGPETVELVEGHGTGTKVGDVVEFEALKTVYREARGKGRWCGLGSVKSQIGHAKAAAGVAGLIKAVLALHRKVLPPTIKVSQPNPKMNMDETPFYVSAQARPWMARADHSRRAAVSAFGFGGSNFHAVLEEYDAEKCEVAWDGSIDVVALSAASLDELTGMVEDWLSAVDQGLSAGELAYRAAESRKTFSAAHDFRLVVVTERGADLVKLFSAAKENIAKKGAASWRLPNVFFAAGTPSGKIAFLFPGQGSQYVGMGRDLVCQFPTAMSAVADTDADADGNDDADRLSDKIYPQPVFRDELRIAQTAALTRTDVAQPAIGAVSLAYLRVLEGFGVTPALTAGHSYGELVALHAAGRIDEQALRRLSRIRGQLMADGQGDRGTMLAVQAPLEELDRFLAQAQFDVVLANRNSPTQGVLSGSHEAIDQAARACASRGWPTKKLDVSAAFHSRFVADAEVRFREALDTVEFCGGSVDGSVEGSAGVFANVSGERYPQEAFAARDILSRQLTHPVRFVEQIQNLYAAGARMFIEVGPKATLTSLVGTTLKAHAFEAVAMDASAGRGSGIVELARVLARLAVAGHPVQLARWERPAREPRKLKMNVPLSGANYRSPAKRAEPQNKLTTTQDNESKTVHKDIRKNVDSERPNRPTNDVGGAPNHGHSAATPSLKSARPMRPTTAGSLPAAPESPTAAPSAAAAAAPPLNVGSSDQLAAALQLVQEGLRAMQSLQQQTAQTHQRFLEGQELAHKTFQQVMESQQRLLEGAMGMPMPATLAPNALSQDVKPSALKPAVASDSAPREIVSHDPAPVPLTNEPVAVGGSSDWASIETALLQTVSEKTGYPFETINLDMHLRDDLGIDAVRQVEILSQLRQRVPGLPTFEADGNGRVETLRDIVTLAVSGSGATEITTHPATSTPMVMSPDVPIHESSVGSVAEAPVSDTGLNKVLLEVVAELTGYPQEMLELDMDLEADLGIDSIKRVEILAAVQAHMPDLKPVDSSYMGSLRTLQQIIDYMSETESETPETPTVASDAPVSSSAPSPPTFATDAVSVKVSADLDRRVLTIVALPPAEQRILRVAPGHEVRVIDDGTPLASSLVQCLKTRGVLARVVPAAAATSETNQTPAGGLIYLAPPTPMRGSVWNPASEDRLREAFALTKALAGDLRSAAAAGGALFVTVSRMGGAFGLKGGPFDPTQGALAGLTKTVSQEWLDVQCHALDVAQDWRDVDAMAEAIVRELANEGRIEIGLSGTGRCGLDTVETKGSPQGDTLQEGDVVIVTGGARGVTAEAALTLAKQTKAALVLLGRSPSPTAEPAWLGHLEGEADIKRAILENEFAQQAKVSPADLQASYRRHLANRQIHRTLQRVEATGAQVSYRSLDVRDGAAVKSALDEIRRTVGPIRGLIHAAGVIEDKPIEEKSTEQFENVFATKVVGLRHLLEALQDDELKCMVLFSSVSGRLGRQGQVDYAMANEVLNKAAHRQAALRPGCRVVAMNWGPWDGGMVTPSLKREFDRLGVPLIPLEAGAQCMVDELCQTDQRAIEVVVGGSFPAADAPSPKTPLHHATSTNGDLAVAFDRQLDLDGYPFLRSHVIAGRSVVPMAMILEWMGHGALHGNPGLVFCGLDDLRVLKGVILNGDPVDVRVLASSAKRQGDVFVVDVELRSGPLGEKEITHARAKALLATKLPDAPARDPSVDLSGKPYPRSVDGAYRDILFHGETFRGIERIEGCAEQGIAARCKSAPMPADWMREPMRSDWLADPLVIDASLQLGILWCYEHLGMASLPSFGAAYRQYRSHFPTAGTTVQLAVRRTGPHLLAADVDFIDNDGAMVARMIGYEWTADESLMTAFGHEHAAGAQA